MPGFPSFPLTSTASGQSSRQFSREVHFLMSLSDNAVVLNNFSELFKSDFHGWKDQLRGLLFDMFNRHVFGSGFSERVVFFWYDNLGAASYKYQTRVATHNGIEVTFVKIGFALAVVDRPSRLRDAMLHALCHASREVFKFRRLRQSKTWKFFARIALQIYPGLPLVSGKYGFPDTFYYVYECESCEWECPFEDPDIMGASCFRCQGRMKFKTLLFAHELDNFISN